MSERPSVISVGTVKPSSLFGGGGFYVDGWVFAAPAREHVLRCGACRDIRDYWDITNWTYCGWPLSELVEVAARRAEWA